MQNKIVLEAYLKELIKEKEETSTYLLSGIRLSGIIQKYDDMGIEILSMHGSYQQTETMFIYHNAISTIVRTKDEYKIREKHVKKY